MGIDAAGVLGRTASVTQSVSQERYRGRVDDDQPVDPFLGDFDPAAALESADEDELPTPISPDEREDVLADLADLEVYRALLEPRGVRGLVVDCDDCDEAHYFGWDLLKSNLRHLLDRGQSRVHEPAYAPDPADYVSWDYARGFADGVLDASGGDDEDELSSG